MVLVVVPKLKVEGGNKAGVGPGWHASGAELAKPAVCYGRDSRIIGKPLKRAGRLRNLAKPGFAQIHRPGRWAAAKGTPQLWPGSRSISELQLTNHPATNAQQSANRAGAADEVQPGRQKGWQSIKHQNPIGYPAPD